MGTWGIECAYSFSDLFVAVHNRPFSDEEAKRFGALSQSARNKLVSQLARKAGWLTKDKLGNDGLLYTAFWPEQR